MIHDVSTVFDVAWLAQLPEPRRDAEHRHTRSTTGIKNNEIAICIILDLEDVAELGKSSL